MGGGVSLVFAGVSPESSDMCDPGFADVCPAIAEVSDQDSVCWKDSRCCENLGGGLFWFEPSCGLCAHWP
jgi:hypothetical protein